ncbi:MAG: hypothetical protein LBU73_05390 [Helicobacteraceae bacterium]|jgi:hypothetical protein|nr:hypothetical protein [Helicobacteraceae bacterium]
MKKENRKKRFATNASVDSEQKLKISMTDTKIYAWIFLTVHEQPTFLNEVLWRADGINHAIPMLEELQNSFGWLQAQGFVRKVGKEYLLTETGATLKKSISHGNIFSVLDKITEKFSQLPEIGFTPDAITEKELDAAYKLNRK